MKTSRHRLLAALCIAATCAPPARAGTHTLPGGEHTGDINLADRRDTFVVNENTTISGRVYGNARADGTAIGGSFIKTGAGTLTLTGSTNWFIGGIGATHTRNTVAEGALVVANTGAIGSGNMDILPGATLVFRDITGGGNFPMTFGGGGAVEIRDSDMTLNWRNKGLVTYPNPDHANHYLATLDIARSRLFALASGTLNGALGGAGAAITVRDHSTLMLGREGIVAGASGLFAPLAYETAAGGVSIDATSALVLNPGASLNITGTLALDAGGARITFGGAGASRLEYAVLDASEPVEAFVSAPGGYSLETTTVTVGGRQRRDYLLVNQGAGPMNDIAATTGAIETITDAVGSRLNELFLAPATEPSKWRQSRRWANTAYARYLASDLDYDADGAAPGVNGRLGGLLLGIDSAWRLRVNLGLHAGLTESSLATTNNTSLNSSQRLYGASITPRIGEKFYLTLDLLAGTADSESIRREAVGDTLARWDNSFHGGGLELGALLRPWGDWFLRPRAALRHTRIGVSGYNERAPAGAGAIAVGDFTDTLARLTVAADAARRFTIPGINREALASFSLAHKHAVREPRPGLEAEFADYPGRSFVLERGDYYEDAFAAGAALRMAVTLRTRVGLAVDYERGAHHDRLTASLVAGCIW